MPSAETQAIRSEEMNVDVARAAMRFKFEMMMLDVRQAVAHFSFAAAERFRPQHIRRRVQSSLRPAPT